jgi:hypothetical protein
LLNKLALKIIVVFEFCGDPVKVAELTGELHHFDDVRDSDPSATSRDAKDLVASLLKILLRRT